MPSNRKPRVKEIGNPYRRMTVMDEELDDETVKRAFLVVERGSVVTVVKRGKLHDSISLRLSPDHAFLVYKRLKGSGSSCVIQRRGTIKVSISMLVDVRTGWNTDRFMRMSVNENFRSKVPESCCFSVVFRKLRHLSKTADFVTETPEEQKMWYVALRRLLNDIRSAALYFNEERWLKKNFLAADLNRNGKLSFHELWELLKKLGVQISEPECKRRFTLSDIHKSEGAEIPALDFEEFKIFFRSLTKRPELKKIMRTYSEQGIDSWTAEDLKNFLETSQGFTDVTIEDCKTAIQDCEPDALNREEGRLSVHGFRLLLLSKWGSVIRHLHATMVFQDMSQPLCDYFIHSTHNTYLLGHQLRGDSTIEGYIRALKCGARVLELDIWEGDYEPLVTHGHTLVNPNTLRNVVQVIDKYAFRASPYPLILSLENHCGVRMQRMMAEIFKTIFKDKIYVQPPSQTVLPSPEQLKQKVLLKCKKLAETIPKPDEQDDEYFDDVYDVILTDLLTPDESIPHTMTIKPGDVVLPAAKPTVKEAQMKKKDKVPIAQELSDLIALKSVKLKDLARDAEEHPWNGQVSISEGKIENLLDKNFDLVLLYASKHLVKVYPSGTRMDSTNVKPVLSWTSGVQIVAMNSQTAGEEADLNNGLFSINDSCGYVLKPKWMRQGNLKSYYELMNRDTMMVLRVQVISAQNLPRPETKFTDSLVDPYVTVEIFGFPFDNQKYRTPYVPTNGFNPVWNSEQYIIKLKVPEIALLRFCVKDHDLISANDFIGQYSLPVMSITQGYSHIPLETGTAHTRDPSAALFVHVEIEQSISDEELCSWK